VVHRLGLRSLVESLQMPGTGWFLAFGEWCEPQVLMQAPFRATTKFFCCNRRLAPSRHYLEGLADRGGAVAYVTSGDDRRPGVVVATSKRIDKVTLSLVATSSSTPTNRE
jgi:hypothetical protein